MFTMLSHDHEVIGTYYSNQISNGIKLDVRDSYLVSKMITKYSPEIIINTSAITDVEWCESHPEESFKINVTGTENIVTACKENNIKLIHISSDYVFNDNFELSPLNYYGTTKLWSEGKIQKELDNYIIIRPTVLYGYNTGNNKQTFVDYVKESLKAKRTMNLNNSNQKYPLLIENIVDMVKVLIQQNLKGIFNITGNDKVTYLEWAKRIAKQQGLIVKKEWEAPDKSEVMRPVNVNFTKNYGAQLEDFSQNLIDITPLDEGLEIVDKQEKCFFKLLYFKEPHKSVLGQSVSEFRVNVGIQMAKELSIKANIVVPIPESGLFFASGYAIESKIPLMLGLTRNPESEKTLFKENREEALEEKLNVIENTVKGKDIILIDEAIVSGNTLKTVVRKLREADVGKIHVRLPIKPMTNKCPARMLPEDIKLITDEIWFSDLKKYFDIDSLRYLDIKTVTNNNKNWCLHCFGGK